MLAERLRLMVLTDPACGAGRTVRSVVEQAIGGGATAVQLRMKDATAREMAAVGRELRALTRRTDTLFLVNDRLDVALCLEADGVHLGEDDLPIDAARRIAPPDFVIGYSAASPAEAAHGRVAGADYLGVGPMYPTPSKPDAGEAVGPVRIAEIAGGAGLPIVGIGGIEPGRARDVIRAGASGIAVIGAVMRAPDPSAAAATLLAEVDGELILP